MASLTAGPIEQDDVDFTAMQGLFEDPSKAQTASSSAFEETLFQDNYFEEAFGQTIEAAQLSSDTAESVRLSYPGQVHEESHPSSQRLDVGHDGTAAYHPHCNSDLRVHPVNKLIETVLPSPDLMTWSSDILVEAQTQQLALEKRRNTKYSTPWQTYITDPKLDLNETLEKQTEVLRRPIPGLQPLKNIYLDNATTDLNRYAPVPWLPQQDQIRCLTNDISHNAESLYPVYEGISQSGCTDRSPVVECRLPSDPVQLAADFIDNIAVLPGDAQALASGLGTPIPRLRDETENMSIAYPLVKQKHRLATPNLLQGNFKKIKFIDGRTKGKRYRIDSEMLDLNEARVKIADKEAAKDRAWKHSSVFQFEKKQLGKGMKRKSPRCVERCIQCRIRHEGCDIGDSEPSTSCSNCEAKANPCCRMKEMKELPEDLINLTKVDGGNWHATYREFERLENLLQISTIRCVIILLSAEPASVVSAWTEVVMGSVAHDSVRDPVSRICTWQMDKFVESTVASRLRVEDLPFNGNDD
ncbi:hypothetical protein MMC18_005703, partial [Xylographa bjoerkii]|nr:hypothetical protein [Xylographa bjoerkii]